MKINWKIRIQNIVWWFRELISCLIPIIAGIGINLNEISTWSQLGDVTLQVVSNPVILVMCVIAILNTVSDPTSKGLGDSELALSYEEPNDN